MAKQTKIGKQEKYCHFCAHKEAVIDYKNTDLLKRYVSSFAKIVPRKRSGLCARHQRKISHAIKRARIMALLPFIQK
ncbi:30S ribosomal protein S18 [Patescibacteria group bacterium]|nr:30S ribosomal protein S18 [Patescibacteria group bacterium]